MTRQVDTGSLSRKELLRRVVIICCSFTRNIAFYRVGQSDVGQPFLSASHPQAAFWREANANFLDIAVLDWCKLFGDKRAEHYWRRVVSNPVEFKTGLLGHIGMDAAAFQSEIDAMRRYRDKFVAHLDKLKVMDIPVLDAADAAVQFYHRHIVEHEAAPAGLLGLPDTAEKLSLGYVQCVDEADDVFKARRL